ncbi:DUF6630 family protein [Nocardia aurea]|uniref:DUF4253 domain-containing protein n=1 Tax=Nocardia aurea TaxID=2144174 RepID=A0ABV3G2Z9_9NOCA
MIEHQWDRFVADLSGVMNRSPAETVLILDLPASGFMQFIKTQDSLVADVSDPHDEFAQRYLLDGGWTSLMPDFPTWRREISQPDTCHEVALEAVHIIRELFSVRSPEQVEPQGWVDGPGEVHFGQLRPNASVPAVGEVATLVSIAELLIPDQPWLVATVRHRLEDPEQAHRFGAWRGLLSALGEPYFGGLGILAQCDWQQDTGSILEALQQLPSCPETLPWDWYPGFAAATKGRHGGDAVESFLKRVAENCHTTQTALVSLQTLSDDYALTFLPRDRLDRLRALTARVGHDAIELPPRR